MASVFSRIAAGEIPCHKILEDDQYLAFLDVQPLVTGHVLVIPKRETDYIFDIGDDELSGLMVFAKKVATALRKAVPCKRIGIAVIGLEVPHAHVHLVPMQTADDLNFTRPKLKPGQEELAETAALVRSFLV
ncbi:MAG: HIT family protein [Bacteroidetes bacterium]|nr:HIT family protein [Bacteroidota bacterium]